MRGKSAQFGAWGFRARVALAGVGIALAAWLIIGAPRPADAARTKTSRAVKHLRTARTVHVIEHAVTDTVIQSGGTGDVTGNMLTWHNNVYDAADAKQVGTDQGSCVRISPADGSWQCSWTTFLAHGQITVEGPYYDSKNSVLAIIGGTGAYSRARGQMNLNSRNGGKEYDFIFHLR
jgi:allene oxide cyclase